MSFTVLLLPKIASPRCIQPAHVMQVKEVEQQEKARIASCGGYFHKLPTAESSSCLLTFKSVGTAGKVNWAQIPPPAPVSYWILDVELTSLNLGCLTCKMKIIIIPGAERGCEARPGWLNG